MLKHLILGNSVAGIAAAQEIRKHDPAGQIVIVGEEKLFGYSRAMLPLYIAGKRTKQELVFASAAFYKTHGIRLIRGDVADAVDAAERRVRLASGKVLPYDRLLIATGSSSRLVEAPGMELAGVYPLRKFADAEAIKKALRSCTGPIAIIGGGLVGVKSLEALTAKKCAVYLVISSNRILSQMLDRTASDFFLKTFERHGAQVHFQTDVTAFDGTDRLMGVSLSSGVRIPCELAIIGKGVYPNITCVKDTGMALQQGIVVDERMATTVPGIYAAGDVAEPLDVLHERQMPSTIWPSATEGGRIAGLNMAGVAAKFSGAVRMNSVEILGVRVISAGAFEGEQQMTVLRPEVPLYRKLLYGDGRLLGFVVLGDVRCAGVLTSLVKNRTPVSPEVLARELDRGFSFRPRLRAVDGAIHTRELGGMGL